MEMGKKQILDVYLDDIMVYDFTNWRKLMPKLKEHGLLASPHNWGDYLKIIYTAHLAGGLGNVVTNAISRNSPGHKSFSEWNQIHSGFNCSIQRLMRSSPLSEVSDFVRQGRSFQLPTLNSFSSVDSLLQHSKYLFRQSPDFVTFSGRFHNPLIIRYNFYYFLPF